MYPEANHSAVCGEMILPDAPVRPTGKRLLVANIVATGLVALLLGLAGLLASRLAVQSGSADSGRLQVSILAPTVSRPAEAEPQAVANRPESLQQPAVRAPAEPAPQLSDPLLPETVDSTNAPNVHGIAADAVRLAVSDFYRDESLRADMWRQSGSVMFRPGDEFITDVDDPVLADFHFRPEVHVAGLGFTIGSCFIGVPLVGVPVEDRTVAITLFVCARESG